jgi:hypothetical protein
LRRWAPLILVSDGFFWWEPSAGRVVARRDVGAERAPSSGSARGLQVLTERKVHTAASTRVAPCVGTSCLGEWLDEHDGSPKRAQFCACYRTLPASSRIPPVCNSGPEPCAVCSLPTYKHARGLSATSSSSKVQGPPLFQRGGHRAAWCLRSSASATPRARHATQDRLATLHNSTGLSYTQDSQR